MRNALIVQAAFITATFGAAPALAQDAAAPDARATQFSGLYAGGSFGIGVNQDRTSDRLLFDTNGDGHFNDTVIAADGTDAFSPGYCHGKAATAVAPTCGSDKDSIAYSARIGYDRRMNNIVVGGLVEASRSNTRDYTSAFDVTPDSFTIGRRVDYALSARARAGYTPGGGVLFYVTGGASYARIQHAFATTDTANAFDAEHNRRLALGYQAGGGAEIMLTPKVSLGLEYLYSSYNDNKYDVAVTQGAALATNPFAVTSSETDMRANDRLKYHALQATVAYHF